MGRIVASGARASVAVAAAFTPSPRSPVAARPSPVASHPYDRSTARTPDRSPCSTSYHAVCGSDQRNPVSNSRAPPSWVTTASIRHRTPLKRLPGFQRHTALSSEKSIACVCHSSVSPPESRPLGETRTLEQPGIQRAPATRRVVPRCSNATFPLPETVSENFLAHSGAVRAGTRRGPRARRCSPRELRNSRERLQLAGPRLVKGCASSY
jgi:hypothetical protein